MELKEYTQSLGSQALTDAFLDKRIHLICVAVNSLTNYNAFATMSGGITEQKASELASKVCQANETGTLYPKLNMTIIPLTKTPDRDNFGDRALMKKHIQDCFKANEQNIKCPDMLFALEERGDFDYDLAIVVLKEVLESTPNLNFTKNVYYYPYN